MASQLYKELLTKPSREAWRTVGITRRAGALVPLFSVYSSQSTGIGDLEDAKLLIDWCTATGNTILQLLPMNEVGATSCPYDAISSFAIEPAYLSLPALAGKKPAKITATAIAKLRTSFPLAGRTHLDYLIKDEKLRVAREIFTRDGAAAQPPEFHAFIAAQAYWLDDFALYKVIKKEEGGKPWYAWGDLYRNRDADTLRALRRTHAADITFEQWLQWQLYRQFTSLKQYAASHGVLIKGDLPILISRDSADVWAHPDYFKLDFAAGAPPDVYCAKGQRWGVPIYHWERIAQDNYRYMREKFSYACALYDLLRIDHVVGLFRIWAIPYADPAENEGLHGAFDPRDEALWEEHGRRILTEMLNATPMLLCAEDLGMIPNACPTVLAALGIPGNEVQRWVKDWARTHTFLTPDAYRPIGVAMLSTHDTTNWAGWWENEAGTVDEALFMRTCAERGIDYGRVKGALFDEARSHHGRLRWRDDIVSAGLVADILDKRPEEVRDFIELYENTFAEKEKLWKMLGMKGRMREAACAELVSAALALTLNSRSIFCINTLIDYLMTVDGSVAGDPYAYRINTPGTVSAANWSLLVPVSLDKLMTHPVSKKIKKMIAAANR